MVGRSRIGKVSSLKLKLEGNKRFNFQSDLLIYCLLGGCRVVGLLRGDSDGSGGGVMADGKSKW